MASRSMNSTMQADPPGSIRRLEPLDAAAYRALMLDAYARHPDAFTSSAAERAALPIGWWEARLSTVPRANDVVFGAFTANVLVGVAGLSVESREKTRHKATLFGMFVMPDARRFGFGDRLVHAVLDEARSRPEVRLLQLTVTEGNAGAEALYRRHGFASFGVEPMAVAVATDGTDVVAPSSETPAPTEIRSAPPLRGFVSKVHMWLLLDKP